MSSTVPAADYLSASYMKTFILKAGNFSDDHTHEAVLRVPVNP